MDFEGEIIVGHELNTNTDWLATDQYGYTNFCRKSACQILGSNSHKTTKNPLADLKCYDLKDKPPRCEVAITSDIYKTIKGKTQILVEINGISTTIPVAKGSINGQVDINIGGVVYPGATMFYELQEADKYPLYGLLKDNIGTKLKYKISWN